MTDMKVIRVVGTMATSPCPTRCDPADAGKLEAHDRVAKDDDPTDYAWEVVDRHPIPVRDVGAVEIDWYLELDEIAF